MHNFLYISVIYVYFTFLITINVLWLDNLSVLDLLARIFENDFIINTIYFFWTNFFYLYCFVAIVLLFLLTKSFFFKKLLPYIFLIIIIYVNFWLITNYWIQEIYVKNFNGELLNVLLLNSINKYHPLFFYLSLLYLIVFKQKNTIISHFFHKYNHVEKSILNNLILIFFTLGLGSWWALQEGSWGGWWNWDPSEVFGLVVLINILLISHSNIEYFYKTKYRIFLYIFLKLILLLYIIIQLNFDNVSHNFGTRTSSFIEIINIFKWELFIFTLLLIFFIKLKYNIFKFLNKNKINVNLIKIVLLLITLFTIHYSFKQLWIDSIQELLNFSIHENLFNIKWLVIGTLSISLYSMWRFSIFHFITSLSMLLLGLIIKR